MMDVPLVAYFRDIYNIRPVHYDCTLGQIRLPWNGQVCDIFINHDFEDSYRPVLDGLYAEETSGIRLYGDSFSEQDLTDYLKKVREYNAQTEWIRVEKRRVLSEIYDLIQENVHPSLMPAIKALDEWLLIYSGVYALGYDPETKMFSINKYYAKEPFERRYWWWNKDKGFETIKSANKEEIAAKFITVVKRDMREFFNKYQAVLDIRTDDSGAKDDEENR